jgi:hypothetical protein
MRRRSLAQIRAWFTDRLIDFDGAEVRVQVGPSGRGKLRVALRARYRVRGMTRLTRRTCRLPVGARRDEVDAALSGLVVAVLAEMALVRAGRAV